jgi:hypothetical protein
MDIALTTSPDPHPNKARASNAKGILAWISELEDRTLRSDEIPQASYLGLQLTHWGQLGAGTSLPPDTVGCAQAVLTAQTFGELIPIALIGLTE